MDIFLKTIIPIFLLIGLGLLSRHLSVLKKGDERVLSGYVYYFALPSLFFINMAETTFNTRMLYFMFVGSIPFLGLLLLIFLAYFILKFSKETLYLLIVSSIFGSHAFFGLPFVMFAFPGPGTEKLAVVAAGSISIISVIIAITALEMHKLSRSGKPSLAVGIKHVTKGLSTNPLIISLALGMLISVIGIKIPLPIAKPIHMLGATTATVAIFMLGVFLYGQKYGHFQKAIGLSLIRAIILPAIALLSIHLLGVKDLEGAIIVLMHAMPLAISMVVLAERYDFYKETISTVILVSSLAAGLYLNIWLLILGY